MSIKELVLRKGWAGKTISREETGNRLNVLIRSLVELMYAYDSAIDAFEAGEHAGSIESAMRTLRADIGKLSETINSCGLVPYSGTDIEPGSISAGEGWRDLLDLENAFSASLKKEKDIEHQMRSRAIIGVFASNSHARTEIIQNLL